MRIDRHALVNAPQVSASILGPKRDTTLAPTADHYRQRERPAELAKIVKLALSGEVPKAEEGDAFMWAWSRQQTEHDAIFIGHSINREMTFEGTVEYTPQGYLQ